MLYKPIIALGKLAFQHLSVLFTDGVEIVVLAWDVDRAFNVLPIAKFINKRQLHLYGGVKIIQKFAIIIKNPLFILGLGQLVIDVLESYGFVVLSVGQGAYAVFVDMLVWHGILRRFWYVLAAKKRTKKPLFLRGIVWINRL
jgi:hypothetical protein